jgi:hypothetical protein
VFSNKSGKYVGAILRMVFECLPFVIMAKMYKAPNSYNKNLFYNALQH